MEKIRALFFIIGSVLLGVGMVWAGVIKMSNNKYTTGVVYIIVAAGLISLCVLAFMHGRGNFRK